MLSYEINIRESQVDINRDADNSRVSGKLQDSFGNLPG